MREAPNEIYVFLDGSCVWSRMSGYIADGAVPYINKDTYSVNMEALETRIAQQEQRIEELEQRLAEREAVIAYFIHTENPDGHHDSQIRADFWRED